MSGGTSYRRPELLAEALALLAEHGFDAKVLAGGQSLVPMMSAGFLAPEVLVDINRLPGLDHLAVADDEVRVGALVRHRALELAGAELARAAPMLPAAARWISHEAVRNRGTLGGSLVHADPSAEWPAVAVALDARIRLAGAGGEREVPASRFFLGPLAADVEPDELVVEVCLPAAPPRTGVGVRELAYRDGDYAVVGVAAQVSLDDAVVLERGVAGLAAAGRAAAAGVNPTSDATASEGYRRDMVAVFFERAVRAAVEQASAAPVP
jgi:carbon-monoxide dehydrogenase medium subunit